MSGDHNYQGNSGKRTTQGLLTPAMPPATVEKLRTQLITQRAEKTECEVVYILCEVRKLLHMQEDMAGFPTLKLY